MQQKYVLEKLSLYEIKSSHCFYHQKKIKMVSLSDVNRPNVQIEGRKKSVTWNEEEKTALL